MYCIPDVFSQIQSNEIGVVASLSDDDSFRCTRVGELFMFANVCFVDNVSSIAKISCFVNMLMSMSSFLAS